MALKTGVVRPGTEEQALSRQPAAPLKLRPSRTPEEQELARKREELAALETELAERELRIANLRAELSAFERQYLHVVGSRYAELDNLKANLAEKWAQAQPDNERAQQAAREARELAEETRAGAGERKEQEPRAFHATPELKRLYREIAKRIHPDLASDGDDRSRREQLMADANRAYESGDEAALLRILTAYECSPEAVKGTGTGADLVRVIRSVSQAHNRLREIEIELQGLSRSDLFQLKLQVDESMKSGRDLFGEVLQKVENQIALVKEQMAHAGRSTGARPS
jgi:chromosome segregation ATPase